VTGQGTERQEPFELPQALASGIGVTLLVIDEALRDVARLASEDPTPSPLQLNTNTLSIEERSQIAAAVQHMQETMCGMRTTLRLTPERRDSRDAIRSICSIIWQGLTDIESKRLKRYGEVPRDLAGYLDPLLRNLSDQTCGTLDCIRDRTKNRECH